MSLPKRTRRTKQQKRSAPHTAAQCRRCSWVWSQRKGKGAAKKCPNCCSINWDTPYKYATYRGRPHLLVGKRGRLPKPRPKPEPPPAAPTVPADSPLLALVVEGMEEER